VRVAWEKWYHLRKWESRSDQQLHHHPLCKMCLDAGIVTRATIADHVIPHRGNYKLFWFGDLQSLCSPCHSSSKKQIENKGYVDDIGADGYPLDARHPFNQRD
jgi:5-methylcytosine-specific restriction enzyme A